MSRDRRPHLLWIEAREDGHHLMFVQALGDALLQAGCRITFALPRSDRARSRLADLGCVWLQDVDWVPWTAGEGAPMVPAANHWLARTGADEVFWNCIDEWVSPWLRRAAWGRRPPADLRGRMSGVYVRPRPLDPECQGRDGWNGWWKRRGWRALDREGWFRHVYVLDERLPQHPARFQGSARIRFLPEPNQGTLLPSSSGPAPGPAAARAALGIPAGARVFLQFGLGTRRKGTHLVLEAWRGLDPRNSAFLLCAGEAAPEFGPELASLEAAGRARVWNRYVTAREADLCFAAADIVLMPYVDHYGSSNVLSRAAAAGRPVLASDQGLVGFRVRHHGLGELCAHNDASSLCEAVARLAARDPASLDRYGPALRAYAGLGSSEGLRRALAGHWAPP
jgi:glycosyltransferase involved in cell wall biosynthesis